MKIDLQVLREELFGLFVFFNQTIVTLQWCHIAVPLKGRNKLRTPPKNCS